MRERDATRGYGTCVERAIEAMLAGVPTQADLAGIEKVLQRPGWGARVQ
jgi:hypothetical protein